VPGSSFEDLYLVNPAHVRPATRDEVAALESELGVQMPTGYAEYVQRMGEGALGHLVRVYPPTLLAGLTGEWRVRVQEYWFWDTTAAGVEPRSFQERGVLVADTFDGDELCFLPENPDALFLLPRDTDDVVPAGPGLLPAVDWLLGGDLNPWVEGWTFEAFGHQRQEIRREPNAGLDLAGAGQALAELGEHSHVVELDHRQTFFLPAIGGRLSLYQPEDEPLAVDLTYDADADPDAVARLLGVLGL
jgi:hypothetical protein